MAANTQTRFLTHALLEQINQSSIRAMRSRNVYFDRLPISDDGTRYPVVMHFDHNDVEVRTEIVLTGEGEKIFLDMSCEEFASLPVYSRPDES